MSRSSVNDALGWTRLARTPVASFTISANAVRVFGSGMGVERYREVRFEDLVGDSEVTLQELFAWLGEDWDRRVLDYDRFEHDGSSRNRSVRQVARAAANRPIDSTRATGSRRELDVVLRARVERVAGPLNRELGYG